MAFLTGVLFIDAPASALNNAGADTGSRTDNAIAVKSVRTKEGVFPYVSAQAVRYWLRSGLAAVPGYKAAPIRREGKVSYTDGDPIEWWDDDLFGYMRAPSKKANKGDAEDDRLSPVTAEITRVSPFRMSTLIAVAPSAPTHDFGTMSRHGGDPVPHEHQFYRNILKGMFSLDLSRVGTFTYQKRSGFLNLDEVRIEKAKSHGLENLAAQQAYRLPLEERLNRVEGLLSALGRLSGGAKQAIHYTDVTPAVLLAAVVEGGNDPLAYLIRSDERALLAVHREAVRELRRAWGDILLSPIYAGWAAGFQDKARADLAAALEEEKQNDLRSQLGHPRVVLTQLATALRQNPSWMA